MQTLDLFRYPGLTPHARADEETPHGGGGDGGGVGDRAVRTSWS